MSAATSSGSAGWPSARQARARRDRPTRGHPQGALRGDDAASSNQRGFGGSARSRSEPSTESAQRSGCSPRPRSRSAPPRGRSGARPRPRPGARTCAVATAAHGRLGRRGVSPPRHDRGEVRRRSAANRRARWTAARPAHRTDAPPARDLVLGERLARVRDEEGGEPGYLDEGGPVDLTRSRPAARPRRRAPGASGRGRRVDPRDRVGPRPRAGARPAVRDRDP